MGLVDLCKLIVFSSIAVLGFIGFVGNIISVIVWTRPQLKSSSAILLTALAASDSVIIIRTISLAIPYIIFAFNAYTDHSISPIANYMYDFFHPIAEFWLFPVSCIAYTASMYLTLAITLERYIAVCHPFHFKRIDPYRRACVTAATVFIFSILFNFSRFWDKNLMKAVNDKREIVSYMIMTVRNKLMNNPLYVSLYIIWGHLIVDYLLPLAGIVILNTVIYLKLKRANRERKALSKINKIDHQLSKMLLYVVVEFLMCTSVTGFWGTWRTIEPNDSYYPFGVDIRHILYPLSTFLDTFNASVNFVTYVTFWGPFRRTFMQMFCRRKENVQHTLQVNSGDQKRTSDATDTLV